MQRDQRERVTTCLPLPPQLVPPPRPKVHLPGRERLLQRQAIGERDHEGLAGRGIFDYDGQKAVRVALGSREAQSVQVGGGPDGAVGHARPPMAPTVPVGLTAMPQPASADLSSPTVVSPSCRMPATSAADA